MVGERVKAEFERDGVEAVHNQLEQDTYWEGKKQQAIKWLNQQDPQWKRDRGLKALLTIARRTARQTRITLALSASSVALLMLAIYMLWRVLEQSH